MPKLFSFFILIGLFAACSASKPPISQPTAPAFSQEELDAANAYYLKGIVAFELEEYDEALDLLSMAYLRLPEHAGVNYALADAYLATSDAVNAAFYAREAVRIDPSNRFYHLKMAEIHLRSGQQAATVSALQNAANRFPNDLEILYLLASSLTEQGEFLKSNRVYDRILKKDPEEISVYYQKFRNYTALNLPDSAVAQMVAVRKLDPSNILAAQTLGQLYVRLKQPEKAIQVYQEILERRPENTELKMSLTDVYIANRQWNEAGNVLEEVMLDAEIPSETKIELLQYVLSRFGQDPKNTELRSMAARLVETVSTTESQNAMAQAIAADFYSLIEDHGKALEKLEATIAQNPDNSAAWRQRMQLLYMESRYDDVVGLAESAEKYAPEDAFVRFFVGTAYFMKKDHENASVWLRRASAAPARAPFKSIILGTLGDVTYQLNEWDKAKVYYEDALRLNPENDGVLNNYAYYMSLKGERLDEAKKMSERSLRISPKNPSFLDTFGWIHYQLGDYQTALTYISASLENGSQSAEVMEHKGDVLIKLNRAEEAIRFWNQALETDPTRTYLLDRIKEATP